MNIINSKTGEPQKFDFNQISTEIWLMLQRLQEPAGFITTSDVKKVDEALVNSLALKIVTLIIANKTTTDQITSWINMGIADSEAIQIKSIEKEAPQCLIDDPTCEKCSS